TFAALARRPPQEDLYPHLTRADLLVVAPCTANTLAKLAYGIADNVLTEAALAHRGPVLIAPAMNPRMWSHAATRANVETLRTRGVEPQAEEGHGGPARGAEPAGPGPRGLRGEARGEGLARKREMLETKNADLVVFNDVGRADVGFDSAHNEVVLVTRERELPVAK